MTFTKWKNELDECGCCFKNITITDDGDDLAERAWYYQQKKIDKLEKANKVMKEWMDKVIKHSACDETIDRTKDVLEKTKEVR